MVVRQPGRRRIVIAPALEHVRKICDIVFGFLSSKKLIQIDLCPGVGDGRRLILHERNKFRLLERICGWECGVFGSMASRGVFFAAAPAPGGKGHASRCAWWHAPFRPCARCWVLPAALDLPSHWPWLTMANEKECLCRRPEKEGKITGASRFVWAGEVFSSRAVEGLKAEAKAAAENPHGFKTVRTLALTLYRGLRASPVSVPIHRFF